MSDAVHSARETAEERAAALLADAARAAQAINSNGAMWLSEVVRPDLYRLSDVERATIAQLLQRLVETSETEMRASLLTAGNLPDVPEFLASLGAAHVAIAWPMLSRSGLPDDRALAELLVRRSRSFVISRQLRRNALSTENGRLETLIEHADSKIAAAAMKLLIAESRTNDRFDDPRISRRDLPQPIDRQLIWAIAAALREYGVRTHGMEPGSLDPAIANCADTMIAGHDDTESLEAVAMHLADALQKAGLADDTLLVEALNAARLTLYVALLAARSDLDFAVAWEMTVPATPAHMLLLKSVGAERAAASHLLVTMARAVEPHDPSADERMANWIAAYDALKREDVTCAMGPWQLDPGYRAAIAAIRSGDDFRGGHR